VNTCGGTGTEDSHSKGLWNVFILGFLGGLIALLTPLRFSHDSTDRIFFHKKILGQKERLVQCADLWLFYFIDLHSAEPAFFIFLIPLIRKFSIIFLRMSG